MLHRSSNNGLNLIFISHIGFHKNCFVAKLFGKGVSYLYLNIGNNSAGAFCNEAFYGASANTACTTSDDCYFSFKTTGHIGSFVLGSYCTWEKR
jgi:hypothetical protein